MDQDFIWQYLWLILKKGVTQVLYEKSEVLTHAINDWNF